MTDAQPRRWRAILVAAVAAVLVAALGITSTDLGPWYQGLEQPSWKPPDAVFGPGWTVIYVFVAASIVNAWRSAGQSARLQIVAFFGINGLLNVAWSWLFFRFQRPDWALIEVVLLWLSIATLIWMLRRISVRAAWLLAPYLAWVTFAGALNWSVVHLNGPFGAS